MDAMDQGQVTLGAADVYEEFFVPAVFGEWAPRVCAAAEIGPGQRVIDIACGTGVLARAAAGRVGDTGAVCGLDRNDGMLAVARRKAPDLDWRCGRAEALPFDDAGFDRAVSQFGLMFFEDRVAALAEMQRVVRPGGRIAVAVWNALDATPGYSAMARVLERLFGAEIAESIRVPYVLGDETRLRGLADAAGLADARVETVPGRARFPSIEAWVHTDVRGWTLADLIDDDQHARLLDEAKSALAAFVGPDGAVGFDHPALILTATRG